MALTLKIDRRDWREVALGRGICRQLLSRLETGAKRLAGS
jgi:hypothetical protein